MSEENPYLVRSRIIPIQDMYSLLQLEYISYLFRYKTYTRESDKKKWKDIMQMKKVKIDSFAMKNSLPSIFSDKNFYNKYLDKFLGDGYGIPKFQHRDEYTKKRNTHFDVRYWLQKGTEVKFRLNDEILLGTVEKYYEGIVTIRGELGVKHSVLVEDVSRILTDKFLELE